MEQTWKRTNLSPEEWQDSPVLQRPPNQNLRPGLAHLTGDIRQDGIVLLLALDQRAISLYRDTVLLAKGDNLLLLMVRGFGDRDQHLWVCGLET